MWTFEPHVAEEIYRSMLAEAKVPVVLGERLDLKQGVAARGRRASCRSRWKAAGSFAARCSSTPRYEGDLMAKAGVSYTVGRESNRPTAKRSTACSSARRSTSSTCPSIPIARPAIRPAACCRAFMPAAPGAQAQGDKRVQAYNFRMCMTDAPENRVPFPKPAGYDPLRYELLLRYYPGRRVGRAGQQPA